MSMMDDVVAFGTKFGIPLNDEPSMIDPLLLLQRVGLIREEIVELRGAADQLVIQPTAKDAEDFLDASVDAVYAILATCAAFGFDFDEAWRRVHAANMAKERASNADNKRGSQYDVVKPKGWCPPDLSDLVFEPTVRDYLCADNGSTSAFTSPTQINPTFTVELERSFRELRGSLKDGETIFNCQTSDTPDTSSSSSNETTSSNPHGMSPSNSGKSDSPNESTEVSALAATLTLLKEEKKAS